MLVYIHVHVHVRNIFCSVTVEVRQDSRSADTRQHVAPMMPLEKPTLREVDDVTVRLSWVPATFPAHSTPTDVKYMKFSPTFFLSAATYST